MKNFIPFLFVLAVGVTALWFQRSDNQAQQAVIEQQQASIDTLTQKVNSLTAYRDTVKSDFGVINTFMQIEKAQSRRLAKELDISDIYEDYGRAKAKLNPSGQRPERSK